MGGRKCRLMDSEASPSTVPGEAVVMLGGSCRRTRGAPQQEATNPAESCRRLRARVDAQEEMEAQYLSSAWP